MMSLASSHDGKGSFRIFVYEALILFMRAPPSRQKHGPKPPLLIPSLVEVRISTR